MSSTLPSPVSHEFWVVMQKRADGKLYVDLAKTTLVIYLTEEDAQQALTDLQEDAQYYHVVPLLASLNENA